MIVFISDLCSDHPEIYWISGLHVNIGHTIDLTHRYAMSSNCHALLLMLFLLLPCDTFSKGDTPHFEEEALEAKCPRWWPQDPHRATSKTRVAVQQVWLKLFDCKWLQGGPNQPKIVSRWSECEGCLWAGEMGSGSCWNRNITWAALHKLSCDRDSWQSRLLPALQNRGTSQSPTSTVSQWRAPIVAPKWSTKACTKTCTKKCAKKCAKTCANFL